ncbi:Vq motif-containing protein [Thalictrum thalictroides]|uniref:Vq motif-containing protein n=1 Tax=Thalictrum thalictroides TaxID=46969 RepID=A0A7J6WI02_THATH|nr:Vq motif-containing protein [Thalictrum thalictroides]
MSPCKFYDDQQANKKEINGTRPAPLKINKDSHIIHKSSSSSSSSNSSSLSAGAKQHPPPAQQQRHPVIIYTHSPKIIHTKARDFMALVQKLTGLSHSDDDKTAQGNNDVRRGSCLEDTGKRKNNVKAVGHDDTTSSSVITDENCGGGGITDVHQVNSSSVSPAFDPPNPYLSDIPLFTPNSSDFFCSTRPFYRYPDHMFSSPNMNTAISPAMLEVLKSYPDYCN